MEIRRMTKKEHEYIRGAARLLVECFPHSWPTMTDALVEVESCLDAGKIALVAVGPGEVLGFIGALPQYAQTGWELHPLVVTASSRRQGIGTALVRALESEVARRGCLTLYVGSDDEYNQTSLSDCDLYDHLWERIRDIKNLKGHPYEFYQKLGYTIVGVIPDANGLGKPDIWLARRIDRSMAE